MPLLSFCRGRGWGPKLGERDLAKVESRADTVRIPSEESGPGARTLLPAEGSRWMEETHTHAHAHAHIHTHACPHSHTLPFPSRHSQCPLSLPALGPAWLTLHVLHGRRASSRPRLWPCPSPAHLLPLSCLPSWDTAGACHIYIH